MRLAGKEREALAPRRSPDTFAGTFAGMEQGSAILCVDGGVAIPLARSGVQPFGARCVPCQRKYEAMNSMSVRGAVPL
ncbi:MAG: hypothetical protein JWQ73_670 [Variovorax sp.]|jgi:RNA polymerase-binding transcription factor DksA|nr:hypothetical protein [Variovorax sp.]